MTGKASKLASWGWFGTFKGLQNIPHTVFDGQIRSKNTIWAEMDRHLGNVG
jgi:hypothetical protein